MPFYQEENSRGYLHFDSRLYHDFVFPPHLHRHPKAVLSLEGTSSLLVNGKTVSLTAGDAALILPNRLHAFRSEPRSALLVTVFSGEYVPDFIAETQGQRGETPVFHPETRLFDYVRDILSAPQSDSYARRSALYALCGEFRRKAVLTKNVSASEALLNRLLAEVSERCAEDITLASLAAELGYEKHYLSRCFNALMPINFRTLLNDCRMDRALSLLSKGNVSVEEAARLSGFGSTRQFNRVFRDMMGCSPGKWRAERGSSASR